MSFTCYDKYLISLVTYTGNALLDSTIFISLFSILKYTLGQINPKMFVKSYPIILKALLQTLNKENRSGFDLALSTRNKTVNKYLTIPIKFLPNEFSNMKVGGETDGFPVQLIAVPFQKFLDDTCKVISIENTKDT